MYIHNIYFRGEIRKNINNFGWEKKQKKKKNALSGAMTYMYLYMSAYDFLVFMGKCVM